MRADKVHKFLTEAKFLAEALSKDASTKVGAIFLDPSDYTQTTHGYNGIPRGLNDRAPERHERPLKYDYFEHAERNGIYNLARKTLVGSVLLSTNSCPSIGCIRAAIAVGVAEVWLPQGFVASKSFPVALALLSEAGISLVRYDENFELLEGAAQDVAPPKKISQYLKFLHQLPELLSKDPMADAALFLHRDDFTLLARGYSGMPRGAQDDQSERYVEPARSLWVEGAIRNAIYNLVRPMLKGNVALVTATTCAECVRALANVGIREVYYSEPDTEFKKRWGVSIETALKMMDELGIAHHEVPRNG